MKPASPVIPGTTLPDTIYAADQPPYIPLPAFKFNDEYGTIVTRWSLTWSERLRVLFSGNIWLSVVTFRKPLQPVKLDSVCPVSGRQENTDG